VHCQCARRDETSLQREGAWPCGRGTFFSFSLRLGWHRKRILTLTLTLTRTAPHRTAPHRTAPTFVAASTFTDAFLACILPVMKRLTFSFKLSKICRTATQNNGHAAVSKPAATSHSTAEASAGLVQSAPLSARGSVCGVAPSNSAFGARRRAVPTVSCHRP
jgi:hypothetical protein